MLKLVRYEHVATPEERLGNAVELLVESSCRLLANRTHPVLELEGAGFTATVDLARSRTLELLNLAALELGERDLDPSSRFALGAVDLLRDRVLVLTQPFRDVLDRPTTVVGLRLELLEGLRQSVPRRRLELVPKPGSCGALLVDGRAELGGLGVDARLDLRDPLALVLLQCGNLTTEGVLRPLEVGLPGPQSFLDAPLDRREGLGHPVRQLPLAHGELSTPLVGVAPFLRDVGGERVRVGARDQDAELLGLG